MTTNTFFKQTKMTEKRKFWFGLKIRRATPYFISLGFVPSAVFAEVKCFPVGGGGNGGRRSGGGRPRRRRGRCHQESGRRGSRGVLLLLLLLKMDDVLLLLLWSAPVLLNY